MQTQQGSKELGHILTGKEVSYITSWKQWKECWEKESRIEILHSLLHFGFGIAVDYDEAAERICMYLDIADRGDSLSRVFRRSDDRDLRPYSTFGREVQTTEDLRKVLAQKAFQMLCQNFFKNTAEKDYYPPSWIRLVADPQVVNKLFWFFRLNKWGDIPNLGDSGDHNTEIATEFAWNFCLLAWDCDRAPYDRYREVSKEVKEILKQSQPDMITILFGLRKLDVLLRGDRYNNVSKECIEKLQELALKFDLYLPDVNSHGELSRKPQTIEEACLGRSQAARVLLVLRVMQAEEERLDKMRELEKQRRETEKKLKELER